MKEYLQIIQGMSHFLKPRLKDTRAGNCLMKVTLHWDKAPRSHGIKESINGGK